MSQTLKTIRAFLASPSDLPDERREAVSAVNEVNRSVAKPNGYLIDLIGWEDTLAGSGRPQELINKDLDTCEIFVGMLNKRWGSKPSNDFDYSSGFEEEFRRSAIRRNKEGAPEICLYFRLIDSSELIDVGPQLANVLSFKSEIIQSKKYLFEEFVDPNDFGQRLRQKLSDYINRNVAADREPVETQARPPINPNDEQAQKNSSEALLLSEIALDIQNEDLLYPGKQVAAARVRLVGAELGTYGNDEYVLGPHDSNIIYQYRSYLSLSANEESGLAKTGIAHLKTQNCPLWTWLAIELDQVNDWLVLQSFVGTDASKKNAIDLLTAIDGSIQLPDTYSISRADILESWFFSSNSTIESALTYIAKVSGSRDLDIIDKEVAKNNVSTRDSALSAAFQVRARTDVKSATCFLIEQGFGSISDGQKAAVEKVLSEIGVEQLIKSLSHNDDSIRTMAAVELVRRGEIQDENSQYLVDLPPKVTEAVLISLLNQGHIVPHDAAKRLLTRSSGASFLRPGISDSSSWDRYKIEAGKHGALYNNDLEVRDALNFEMVLANFWKGPKESLERARSYLDGHIIQIYEASGRELPEGLAKVLSERWSLQDRNLSSLLADRWRGILSGFIADVGDKSDLGRLRKFVDEGDRGDSRALAHYFGKHGSGNDYERLSKIGSYQFSDINGAPQSILGNPPPVAIVANACLKIAGKDITQLLESNILVNIKKEVVSRCSIASYRRLSEEVIFTMFQDTSDELRRAAAIKAVLSLNVSQCRDLLERYNHLNSKRYYNVIFWLDLASAYSRDVARKIAVSFL